MESELTLRLMAIFVLIGASAFFSGSEAAFFSLGKFPLLEMEGGETSRARVLKKLLEFPRKLIITIIIGNETVNILISIMVASVYAAVFLDRDTYGHLLPSGDRAGWVSLISIFTTAFILFVLGETLPKTAGIRFARGFTAMATFPLYFFFRLFFPIRYVLRTISDRLMAMFGIDPDEDMNRITNEEVISLLKLGKEEGVLDLTEEILLQNIFDFGDIQVYDVMTPSQEIFRLPVGTPVSEIVYMVQDKGFSRIPVYQDSPDNIIGVLNAKDLINMEGQPEAKITSFLHAPYFIPRQKRISELLRDFQTRRTHLALVVNEFGAIIGLVTMEDVLEEIFGEASSEKPEEAELVEVGEGSWEVLGRMELNTFREKFDHRLSAPGVRTLGGYLLYMFGRMPSIGESITSDGFRFTVKEVRRMRIHRVLLEKESAR